MRLLHLVHAARDVDHVRETVALHQRAGDHGTIAARAMYVVREILPEVRQRVGQLHQRHQVRPSITPAVPARCDVEDAFVFGIEAVELLRSQRAHRIHGTSRRFPALIPPFRVTLHVLITDPRRTKHRFGLLCLRRLPAPAGVWRRAVNRPIRHTVR